MRSYLSRAHQVRRQLVVAGAVAGVALLTGTVRADLYWDGGDTVSDGIIDGGSGTWGTDSNWIQDSNGSQVSFSNTGVNFFNQAGTVTVGALPNLTNGTLRFFTDGLTLSGGALPLGNSLTIASDGGWASSLQAAVTVDSLISNAGGGTYTLTRTGGNGAVRLTNAGNSFTGFVSANNGVLEFTSIADSGSNSSLGAGSNLTLNGGILRFVGPTNQSSNRTISLTGTSVLEANGASGSLLSLSGAVTNTSSSNRTLTLAGYSSGEFTGGGTIANGSGAGLTAINKRGSGTWALRQSAANAFSGGISLWGGGLEIDNRNYSGGALLATNALNLHGGSLKFIGNSAGTTQTLGAVKMGDTAGSIGAVSNRLILDNNGGALTLNTGAWSRGPGSALNVTFSGSGTSTFTATGGIANGADGVVEWATVKDAGGLDFATLSGTSIVRATPVYAAVDATNAGSNLMVSNDGTSVTRTAALNVAGLKIVPLAATAGSLDLKGFALQRSTTADGPLGILFDGTSAGYTIDDTSAAKTSNISSNSNDVIFHTFGTNPLIIKAGMNGSTANYMKAGPGILVLAQSNQIYGSNYVVGDGILRMGAANTLSPNAAYRVGDLGRMELNGFSQVTRGIVQGNDTNHVSGVIANGAATDATLAMGGYVGNTGASLSNPTHGATYTGRFTDGGTGKLNLEVVGGGTQGSAHPQSDYTGTLSVRNGTLSVPYLNSVGTSGPLGAGSSAITLGSAGRQGVLNVGKFSSFDLNNTTMQATDRPITLASGGAGAISVVGNPITQGGVTYPNTVVLKGDVSGSGDLVKYGQGSLSLSGAKSYTGKTVVSEGILLAGAANSLGGTGKSIEVRSGGALATSYALDQTTLDRVSDASAGVVALGSSSSENLDFTGKPNLSLGAVQNFGSAVLTTYSTSGAAINSNGLYTYSGTITPANNTYRIGGGGGLLAISNPLTGAGNSASFGTFAQPQTTTVALTADNTFGGTTTIRGATNYVAQTGSAFPVSNSAMNVTLSGGGALSSTPQITIDRSGLLRMMGQAGTSSATAGNRVNDAAAISLGNGSLEFSHANDGNTYYEKVGAVSLVSGHNTISSSPTSGAGFASTLEMDSLSRSATSYATVNFAGSSLGADARNNQKFTAAPTLGAWATYNNAGFATVTAGNVTQMPETASISAAAWTDPAKVYNFNTAVPAGFGTVSPYAIRNTASNLTVSMNASDVLNVKAVMSSAATLTVGNTAGVGSLTSPDTELYLFSPGNLAINANVTGNKTVVKSGATTTTLAGTANAISTMVVNSGNLNINHPSAVPTTSLVLNGGTFGISADGTYTLGAVTKVNAESGIWVGQDYRSNILNINGGIELNNAPLWIVTPGGLSAGSINVNSAVTGSGELWLGSTTGAYFNLTGTTDNTYSGPTYVYSSAQASGAAVVTLNRPGKTAIPGNLFIGRANVVGANGLQNEVVTLATGEQIANGGTVHFGGGMGSDAGILRLNGNSETIAGLVSLVTGDGRIENNHATAASTLTIDAPAGSKSHFSGLLRDGAAAKLNFVKNGLGTQTLGAESLYSGTTTVNDGTLLVRNTSGSATGTGAVTVNGGSLGGSGTISGPVNIMAAATLSPGESTGIINTGALTLDGTLLAEINGLVAGQSYDQVQVTGDANIAGDLVLALGYAPSAGDSYTLLHATGNIAGLFGNLSDGAIDARYNLQDYRFNVAVVGNDLVATYVPEPSVILLASTALFSTLSLRPRRRPTEHGAN